MNNALRIRSARTALRAWRVAARSGQEDECDARDLIADLLHLAEADGLDAEQEAWGALNNYREERTDHE